MNFDINRFFPDEHQDFGDSGRASFEEKRPLYLSAGKHFLNLYGEEIKAAHRAGACFNRIEFQAAAFEDGAVRVVLVIEGFIESCEIHVE